MRTPDGRRYARFRHFVADLATGELRWRGKKVKVQRQPFEVLAALLEKAGDLVTREELQERIWPAGTFVDFEQGLNKSVQKIRKILRDSASRSIFIETLPGRGYRFKARVEFFDVCPEDDNFKTTPQEQRKPHDWFAWLAAIVAVAIIALAAALLSSW